MRFCFGIMIAVTFGLGSYVAFSSGPDMLDRLLHTPKPEVRKVFVPPAKPVVTIVEAPEIQAAPLPPAVIPGVALPPPPK